MASSIWQRLFGGTTCNHQFVKVERGGINHLSGTLHVCKSCGKMIYKER